MSDTPLTDSWITLLVLLVALWPVLHLLLGLWIVLYLDDARPPKRPTKRRSS